MKSVFSVQNNVVNVCCPYPSMLFPYIGNVKYPHGRTYQQQRFKSKRRKIANGKDCVTFRRTTAYHCCHSFSPEATRIFHSVMNDSWSALPWKYDPWQMIRMFLKTPVVFSGFSRGVARIFPEIRPTFYSSSCPPLTANLNIFKVPVLEVGFTVVSQSIFAVYEMTQPLKFLNSVGLLGSLTSTVYH